MVDVDSLTTGVSVLGTVISLFMFLSPAKHFRGIVETRSVGQWSVTPQVIGCPQCLLWFIYSVVTPDRVACAIINAIGAVIHLSFCLTFLYFATGQRFSILAKMMSGLGTTLAASLIVISCADTACGISTAPGESKVTMVLGFLCVIFNIVMNASPLEVFGCVVFHRADVTQCLPWLLSASILANSVCWGAYGILKKDVHIFCPAGTAIILAAAQLALYFCYRNRSREPADGVLSPTRDGLLCVVDREAAFGSWGREASLSRNAINNNSNDNNNNLPSTKSWSCDSNLMGV
ncbi:unnamed protein product [Polarella glacialis]|uniref:Sugar transporter SWEET1 n=1 Tax=Polarella glacialis TaxID=89957 RepID=A0A813L3R7_POLGL|nr:unnamed protein product [Polarella glacialis]